MAAPAPYCIRDSWQRELAYRVDLSDSWQRWVGAYEISDSWQRGFEYVAELTDSWERQVFEAETYNLFVGQPVPVPPTGPLVPPSDPLPGDHYTVPAGATGAWVGEDGNAATWDGIEWSFAAIDSEMREPRIIVTPSGGSPVSVNNYYEYGSKLVSQNVDYTKLKALTITQRRGSPSTMDAEIWDDNYEYGPGLSGFAAFDVNTHKDGQILKTWKPVIKVGGTTWNTAPEFLLTNSKWKIDNRGRAYIKLTGVDCSQMLLEETDVAFKDYNSESAGALIYASDIIKEILESRGVPYRISIRDYPVLRFSAIGGNPLDWVKALLYFAQAEWWFEGRTFCARTPNYDAAAWTFQDIYQIRDFEVDVTRLGLFNELQVTKEEVTASFTEEFTCRGRQCIGIQTQSWSTPFQSAQVYIRNVVHGELGVRDMQVLPGWVFRDQNNEALPSTLFGPSIIAPRGRPTQSVQFIYRPFVGVPGSARAWPPGLEPGYTIQVMGRPFNETPEFAKGFDKSISVKRANTSSQNRFGRKVGRAVNTSSLGRKVDVEYLVQRLLEENALLENAAGVKYNVLNPFVKPADVVRLKVGYAGWPGGKNWVVTSIVKDAMTGSMSMNLNRSNSMS